MIIIEKVLVCCTYNNKKWVEDSGYEWKSRKKISIDVKDLNNSCEVEVEVLCDYCLEYGIKKVIKKNYSRYKKLREVVEKDCCSNKACMSKKHKDVMMKKYGVSNARKVPEISREISETRKTKKEEIKKLLFEKNCIFIEDKYDGNNKRIPYICNNHKEKEKRHIQYVTLGNLRSGRFCNHCGVEKLISRQTGEQSHFWKGGVTQLNDYLRCRIEEWRVASLRNYNNECIITGKKKNLHIHHLKTFNSIVKEALKITKLDLKSFIHDYEIEDRNLLSKTVINLHNKYPLGVPISKSIHSEFHNIYGTDCSEDDFISFLKYKYNIDLDKKYEYVIVTDPLYFEYKINSSSKYKGVCYVDSAINNKWKVTYRNSKGKVIELGYFLYEYEAAEAYNKKCIEEYGEFAVINKLDDKDKPNDYEYYKKYYSTKENKSSRFYGIHKNKDNLYVARLTYNSQRIEVGQYGTELEAAYFYNKKVGQINEEYNESLKLNYLTEDELDFLENELIKYFQHNTKKNTIYTSVFLKEGRKMGNRCWECYFEEKGKVHYVGSYYTDREAAQAYNEYIKTNGLKRKLNKIVDKSIEEDEINEVEFYKVHHKFKNNSTSKYTGISLINGQIYRACVQYKGDKIDIGNYKNELEAVYYYNKKIQEINNKYDEHLKINYLTDKEIEDIENSLKYYNHKDNCSTIYTCIYNKKGVKERSWYFKFKHNKKVHEKYGFKTDKEAAHAYNEYVTSNKLNKKLNRIN